MSNSYHYGHIEKVFYLKCQLPSNRILQSLKPRYQLLGHQSQLYSGYKSSTILKALVGCDLNGIVVFISGLFTGYISDKAICEQSVFFQLFKDLLEKSL